MRTATLDAPLIREIPHSDVEAELHHVAVLHHVLLAFDAHLAGGLRGGHRAGGGQVVVPDDLVAAGSMAAAKSSGKVRMEGKDYVMADGDVVEFRFNV